MFVNDQNLFFNLIAAHDQLSDLAFDNLKKFIGVVMEREDVDQQLEDLVVNFGIKNINTIILGMPLLHSACEKGNIKLIKKLIQLSANINMSCPSSNQTPLMVAYHQIHYH